MMNTSKAIMFLFIGDKRVGIVTAHEWNLKTSRPIDKSTVALTP